KEDRSIVGIGSDRDGRNTSPFICEKEATSSALNNELKSIMRHPVVTIHPLDFVEEIARIFYDEEFASLRVVKNNKLIGIVTEKDMFYTLIQLTGTHVQSSHIEVKVPH